MACMTMATMLACNHHDHGCTINQIQETVWRHFVRCHCVHHSFVSTLCTIQTLCNVHWKCVCMQCTHSRMLYKSNEWNTSYLSLLLHIARDMPFTKYIRSIFASRTNSPTDQLPINCFSIDFIDIDAATHTLAYTIDVQKTLNRRNVKFSIVKFSGNEK